MARTKFTGLLSEEREKTEYDSWVAGTHQKLVPLDSLHEHPDNWDLVGHMDEERRKGFLEDIRKNSIREPLQVWFRDGKLVVVSGHERLSAAREIGMSELPCIKVDFASETEARQHIFAANKHRKTVKLPPPELMKTLFPPEDYPLMYADLRANYAYENGPGDSASGAFTPEERKEARARRTEERKIQSELRDRARKVMGYSKSFTADTVKEAAQSVRKKKKPEVRELTAAQKKKTVALFRDLGSVRSQIGKKEPQFKKLKTDLSELRKKEKRIGRELLKLGVVDDV